MPPASPTRGGVGVLELRLQPVAQREHRRQERDRRAVVGVAAAVGLGRHVVGDRDAARPARPARAVMCPAATSSLRMRSGGGREELRRHLDPRHLGDDAVRGITARRSALKPATR